MCPEKPAPQVKLSSNTGLAFVSICVPGAGLSSGQHVFCEKPPGAPCEVHATDNVVGAESCQACLCFVPKPVFVLLLQILSMWAPRSGDTSFPCSPWGGRRVLATCSILAAVVGPRWLVTLPVIPSVPSSS